MMGNQNANTNKIVLFVISVTVLILVLGNLNHIVIPEFQSVFSGFNPRELIEGLNSGSSLVQNQPLKVVDEESATIEAVEKASPSVVSVVEQSVSFNFFTGPQSREASIGTGFIAGEGLIITNKHVVSDTGAKYSVLDNDGNSHPVSKIYRDPLNDLAIMEIEDDNLESLELGDSDSIKVGQTVVAIGNALGRFSNTVTKGVVSGVGRGITAGSYLGQYQQEIEDVIQTDAALNPGNSGGPLLNLGGQVIGVNVAISEGSQNIGFAIPVNRVRDLIDDFIAGVERARPYLGVSYVMITDELANQSAYPVGALIRGVVDGGAADVAGIKVNDVITMIDGKELGDNYPLVEVIKKHKVGDTIEVKLWRDGKDMIFSLELGAAPQ